MRILIAHNFYQQPGGEDQVFAAESRLLEEKGHFVYRLTRSNESVRTMKPLDLARATLWNGDSYREVRRIIRDEHIEVAHFHNTFPLISPSAYYAARHENVPVVQTLHNYRLLCPGSLLYREGRVCEECLSHSMPWPGIVHSCYRASRLESGAVVGMLTLHRMLRTWSRTVDVYIALTEFARSKFVEGGMPADRIAVKPNFLDTDPGVGPAVNVEPFALFAGRLTEDKGIKTLLSAWRRLGTGIPLKIAGRGPLSEEVRRQCATLPHVDFLGACQRDELLDLMRSATVLIMPSLWYEGLPMTLIEAWATGLPAVASDLGSLRSLVREGITGYRFPAGDDAGLARCVERAFDNPATRSVMRENARAAFLDGYSAESGYRALLEIYERAARRARDN